MELLHYIFVEKALGDIKGEYFQKLKLINCENEKNIQLKQEIIAKFE